MSDENVTKVLVVGVSDGGGGGVVGGVSNLGRLAVAGLFYALNRLFR